jgi:diguanylate cyclase (GGDEF)-like protein
MRVVAGWILALSLPTALALLNPAATRWPAGRPILAVAAVTCVALAVPWLRHSWPSRMQSTCFVVVGTIALAFGCTVAADPLAGLLLAVAFPFILGYTALCHSVRLQVFTIAVAALTVGWLAARIAAGGIPTAIAVVTPIVLLSVAVVYACRTVADLSGAHEAQAEVDLVTGLPTRESFYEQASTLLGARQRDDDRYLVLILVSIDALGAIADMQGSRSVNRVRVRVAQAVRESVRRGAVLGHNGENDFLVADTFTTADPAPLIERLRGAIAATPSGITASMGVVSTALRPLAERPPDEVLDELLDQAGTAMRESRKAGGNQARYRVA